ncbi:MAG: thermonuclease family protein [Planctomycetes bacterium]|nr:thermonuclease family protein [Planctomycetota bacterium]
MRVRFPAVLCALTILAAGCFDTAGPDDDDTGASRSGGGSEAGERGKARREEALGRESEPSPAGSHEPPPPGATVEDSPLAGEGEEPFGAHAASRIPDVQLRERAIGLKRPEDSASPALRLLGTESGERELSPEERVRWEFVAVRPDLSVELVAERTEGPKRTFRLGAIEFPPDRAPFFGVREAAVAALKDALSGRLIQVRRDGTEDHQIQTLDGWANLALVEQGLAWLELETDSSLTAVETDELLCAQREALQARIGLWEHADLSGTWILAGDALHRAGCPRAGEGGLACPEPAAEVSRGARLCPACLVK